MPCNYSHLQDNFYKRFDGAVSKTVLLKEFENKVFLTNPLFFAFTKMQVFFVIYMFAEKKHVLMYYAHVKRLHSVKWRSLSGDTALRPINNLSVKQGRVFLG